MAGDEKTQVLWPEAKEKQRKELVELRRSGSPEARLLAELSV